MWVKDSSVSTNLQEPEIQNAVKCSTIKSDNKGSDNSSQRSGKYEKHALSKYDDKRQRCSYKDKQNAYTFGEGRVHSKDKQEEKPEHL